MLEGGGLQYSVVLLFTRPPKLLVALRITVEISIEIFGLSYGSD